MRTSRKRCLPHPPVMTHAPFVTLPAATDLFLHAPCLRDYIHLLPPPTVPTIYSTQVKDKSIVQEYCKIWLKVLRERAGEIEEAQRARRASGSQ